MRWASHNEVGITEGKKPQKWGQPHRKNAASQRENIKSNFHRKKHNRIFSCKKENMAFFVAKLSKNVRSETAKKMSACYWVSSHYPVSSHWYFVTFGPSVTQWLSDILWTLSVMVMVILMLMVMGIVMGIVMVSVYLGCSGRLYDLVFQVRYSQIINDI